MVSTWLKVLEPLTAIIPDVEKPTRVIQFRQKVFYTFMCLVVYLLASQIPLYGLSATIKNDPLYWLRSIFASQRGTLMELGIGPSMTSGLIIRILIGAKVLNLNRKDPHEMAVFQGVQQLLGAIFTLLQALLYMFAGMYGPIATLGLLNAGLIVVQLTVASVLVQLLDTMMERGWGIGSGISLFTTANVCENIIWKSLSFTSVDRGYGKEYEGAIFAFFHLLFTHPNKLEALRMAFFRQGLPNLTNLIATVGIFAIVIHLQGTRKPIRIDHKMGGKSVSQSYPIKLLYASSTPMMLQSAVTSNIFQLSQALYRRMGNNIVVRLLGSWSEVDSRPGQLIPTGGIAWILAPPYSITSALTHPIHTILHASLMLFLCGQLAALWVDMSGESAADIAANLESSGWTKAGFQRKGALKKELNRYIPTAAVTGGVIIGALGLVADLFGAIGSGTGILLAANTLIKVYESAGDHFKQA